MSSLTVSDIKSRAVKSFVSLTGRQIFLRAVSFVSINVILAKILPVETLGVFNIATGIITFFAFFSDVGLAAALIQKKDHIDEEDIKTTFTIQELIVGILSLIIIVAAPWFADYYKLGSEGAWLIRILGISFFLTSFKVIPSVMLERELRFQPLVLVEMAETLIFNILLVVLSFMDWGLWAFSVAAITRSVTGVTLIYLVAPVRVGVGVSKAAANKLLNFGIPFQLNSLLALLKDRLVPLVIAGMVGTTGVGFITWSQAMAYLPLEIMNVMIRITFPAFSRLQDDKETLSKAVEKSLFITTLAVFPMILGMAALMPFIVSYIVSPKWQPALLSFYLFCVSAIFAVISTTFTNTLNAIGHIKSTLKLMVMWTVLTWGLTPLLVSVLGFSGVAVASFLISFTSVITIILVKRILPVRILEAIFLPFSASLLMAVSVHFFADLFVKDALTLIAAIALGVVEYGLLLTVFAKEKIWHDYKSIRQV